MSCCISNLKFNIYLGHLEEVSGHNFKGLGLISVFKGLKLRFLENRWFLMGRCISNSKFNIYLGHLEEVSGLNLKV